MNVDDQDVVVTLVRGLHGGGYIIYIAPWIVGIPNSLLGKDDEASSQTLI